jgi:hypothetical protein
MVQDVAGADNQVIHLRGDGLHLRRTDEHSEGVGLRYAPRAASRLCQVDLAAPAGHDHIVGAAARASEAEANPERDGGGQVVTRCDGEGANGGAVGLSDIRLVQDISHPAYGGPVTRREALNRTPS